MDKERAYKIVIVFLVALVLVMGLIMILNRPPEKAKIPSPPRAGKAGKIPTGKIAIVIDDVGYSLDNFKIIEKIKYPVTFSVLPGLSFSESAALKLSELEFQIILHLPMEPKENTRLEANTILTSMDESLIRSIINADLEALPKVIGVSNHMGSKATQDEKTMSVILDVLKNKHMFFLDSFVTADSVARQIAGRKHIKFAQRDVFLDNSLDPFYIRKQIAVLKQKARLKGQAIGIGHNRKTTLEVLWQEMPKIEKEGYKFVFVSDLAR